MKKTSLIFRFHRWRLKHIDEKYYLIFLSLIIGFITGVAAYFLKSVVFFLEETFTHGFGKDTPLYWLMIAPTIGIIITVLLIKYIIKDKTAHGIPRILFVISRLDGKMKRHKFFSSILGGGFTAGFGGSAGLESPIIAAGASVGSTFGQLLKMNYKRRTLLIGCGAAGAMASIFTTPVAAVIFSLEVLMLELATSSIIPLLIASGTGAITAKLLMSDRVLVEFKVSQAFDINHILWYVVLGAIAGLISLYFNWAYFKIQFLFSRIRNVFTKAIIGGLLLGGLIFLFPPLFGEGYDALKNIISGNPEKLLNNTSFLEFQDVSWFFLLYISAILLLKVVATAITTESGGVGGIFAPAAVTGGLAGFVFASVHNLMFPENPLHVTNFTLVGMAGVLGAILHAPLTAIFLVAELTHGYELIVPLMITTAFAYVTIKTFAPHSIFTRALAERGDIISRHKDKTVLTLLNVRQVIDTDFLTILPNCTLEDLTTKIEKSKRNLFPVVNNSGEWMGMVVLDDVREDMFHPEKWKKPISDYLIFPDNLVSPTDTMEKVMKIFKNTGNYNLPVVENGKYLGFVSRSNLFNAYRKTLIDVSDE